MSYHPCGLSLPDTGLTNLPAPMFRPVATWTQARVPYVSLAGLLVPQGRIAALASAVPGLPTIYLH